jgi:hypothetical protein
VERRGSFGSLGILGNPASTAPSFMRKNNKIIYAFSLGTEGSISKAIYVFQKKLSI